MKHGKKNNHLGRTTSHRQAMLSNMASSLIIHKRITTTVAKAKELRKYVEPLITKAKLDSTHSRRVVFSYLQDKESIKSLFGEVATRTAERPGGYTRIIKLGEVRLGDSAEMCMMELVDFNDIYGKDVATKKSKTRRRKKAKSKDSSSELDNQSQKTESTEVEATKEKETETKADTEMEVSSTEAKNDNKAEAEIDTTENTDSQEEPSVKVKAGKKSKVDSNLESKKGEADIDAETKTDEETDTDSEKV